MPALSGSSALLLVTVVIPTYNEATRIGKTVRRHADEVVVVDDGSTDPERVRHTRRMNRMSTGAGVREVEPQVMPRWSDPWAAVVIFGRMLATVAEAEALLVVDRDWGIDVWTVVNRSSSQTREQLADRQWNFMQVFPDLDVDFHILDRRDDPMESFVRPGDYDMYIRLKANAHSGPTPSAS